ncbi:MAG: hypothetical protein AAGA65_20240 [Actinomycetota bacterium]
MREHYGLSSQFSESRANVDIAGIKVEPEDAQLIASAQQVRGTVDVSMLRESVDPSSLLGVHWQPSTKSITIYVTADRAADDPTIQHDAVAKSAAEASGEADLKVTIVPSPLNAEEIAAFQDEVMAIAESMNLKGSVGSSIDVTCGRIMMIFGDMEDMAGVQESIAESEIIGLVYAPNLAPELADRYDHHQDDQSGGLGLRPVDETTWNYLGNCTSGIAFKTSGGSDEYAITTGHCLRKQAASGTSMQWACDATFYQGGINIGSFTWCTRYQYGGRVDAAAQLKYSNEGGSREAMIHGGNHTMVWMTGWDRYRSSSAIGDQVCHSGRNWAGSPCGTITSFNHDWCQPNTTLYNHTCFDDLIDTSMPAIGGDSGAAVWAVRNGFTYYLGIVQSTTGDITHIQDMRSALGLGNAVYVN